MHRLIHLVPPLITALAVVQPAATAHAQSIVLLETLNPDLAGAAAQNLDPGPEFGYAVAAHGEWLMVGIPGYRWSQSLETGSVYQYRRIGDGWHDQGVFPRTQADDFAGARCGHAVAVVGPGTTALTRRDKLIGCPAADNPNTAQAGAGAALLETSFPLQIGFNIQWGDTPAAHAGGAVAIARRTDGGSYAVIGMPGAEQVLILKRNSSGPGWLYETALTAAGGTPGDRFGHAVAVAVRDGTYPVWVAVGAPQRTFLAGAVYIFYLDSESSQWVQAGQPINAPVNPQFGDLFGAAVAYHANGSSHAGDLLVIGAPNRHTGGDTGLGYRRGTVSVFRHAATAGTFTYDEDVQFQCLIDPGGTCQDRNQGMSFGHAVAIDRQENIWIGAPNFDQSGEPGGGNNVGRVYRARYTPPGGGALFPGWRINRALSPGPLSEDCGAQLIGAPGGRFGWALAPVGQGIAVGYPRRGCRVSINTDPSRRGQVRIYGRPDFVFDDRFEP